MKRRRLLLAGLPVLVGVLAWWGLPWCTELPAGLLVPQTPSVTYLARDGSPLRQMLARRGDRTQATLSLSEIPDDLVKATLAAEDRRFWSHGGVDLLAVARAFRDNLLSGRVVSGASTIHQQLVKVAAAAGGRRTLGVKLREALQARRLAMSWPRERILAEYLGRISYGNLLTGCATASSGYFNKPLTDLTLAEAAFLAALPQSPSRLNPFRNKEAVRPRQQHILATMNRLGWVTAERLQAALAEPQVLQRFTGGFEAPHAVGMMQKGPETASARVRTTIDAALQQQVERIISSHLSALRDRHVTQAAAVVIDNPGGDILALAGSRDFFSSDGGQINGAWVAHSPGSAIKPFTYQMAFERGFHPASILGDLPVEYPSATGTYRPENYAHRFYGPVTCREALGNSLNIATVRLLADLGGPEPLLQRLRDLGLGTLTEAPEHYGLGLTIGNAPVRLIELANAYACMARLGAWLPWRLSNDRPTPKPRQLLNKEACYLCADILSDNQARSLTFGLHSALRLPFRVAVKTGTSQSYRDNWTLGYTQRFTVAVWTGNFDNTPMQEVSGVTGAAPIWRDIFLHLHEHQAPEWYEEPEGIVRARIDPRNGRLLSSRSPAVRLSREEVFISGSLPSAAGSLDYDERGRALLPPEYDRWVRSAENRFGDLVACRAAAGAAAGWTIAHPVPGTVIQLDPDLPGGGRRLMLETRPPLPDLEWSCGSLEVRKDGGLPFVMLSPGRHEFTVRHPQTGEAQRTHVIVHADPP
ncbi:MAG: Monofunctional biosynthetic peptidoglycan transglycosylase [Prosthecobacter sp.]|nr:Monofunctional biosynthetic peptidoglycan transglycosylase [Prosthecobacter sp.]